MPRLLPIVLTAVTIGACSGKTTDPGLSGTGPAPPSTGPAAQPTTVLDLGDVPTNTDIPFDVPEGALGFNITAEGGASDVDADAPFGIERVVDPSGRLVHSNYTPVGGNHDTSTIAFDAIAAVSVPQGDAVRANLGGAWKLRVGFKGAPTRRSQLHVRVRIQKTDDGVFHGATLDLHIHIPEGLKFGTTAVDTATVASSAVLQARVDRFFEVTRGLLNIDRGEVVFHLERASLASLDGVDALVQGFSVSDSRRNGLQELHMLFTNDILQDGQPIAAGISPGVPGAATIFGRGVSGIIISPSDSTSPVEDDVQTMVHEMGHFIGLNHTTEFDGVLSDPLTDTPLCTTMDGTKTLSKLRLCPDRTNIMFAAAAIDLPIALSPTQKRIYQGSPIFKLFGTQGLATRSLANTEVRLAPRRYQRLSGLPLTPAEEELAMGFCGLVPIDAEGLAARYGRDALVEAAYDPDVSAIVRGRARLALRALSR
jgi:hypothetical protein